MMWNALNLLVRFALLCNFPLLISLDAPVLFPSAINIFFNHSVFVPFTKYPRNFSFTIDTSELSGLDGVNYTLTCINIYPSSSTRKPC